MRTDEGTPYRKISEIEVAKLGMFKSGEHYRIFEHPNNSTVVVHRRSDERDMIINSHYVVYKIYV